MVAIRHMVDGDVTDMMMLGCVSLTMFLGGTVVPRYNPQLYMTLFGINQLFFLELWSDDDIGWNAHISRYSL